MMHMSLFFRKFLSVALAFSWPRYNNINNNNNDSNDENNVFFYSPKNYFFEILFTYTNNKNLKFNSKMKKLLKTI